MQKKCTQCDTILEGRADKRFCSTPCKNNYFNALRKSTHSITKEIDQYLHRNHAILATLMGEAQKETFDRLIIVRTGFKFDYMTEVYFNKEGKMYRIVYNYAWMEFSDQKILIVRKSK